MSARDGARFPNWPLWVTGISSSRTPITRRLHDKAMRITVFPWFTPKFVSAEARVADEIRRAARAFIERTKSSSQIS
jgi:hypothetical protein